MYKLYDMSMVKLMDKSGNERDIIETLGELVSENTNFRYLIIQRDEQEMKDEIYKSINSVADYYMYVRQYQRRLLEQEKTCLELKKEIIQRNDGHGVQHRNKR